MKNIPKFLKTYDIFKINWVENLHTILELLLSTDSAIMVSKLDYKRHLDDQI